ncbi:MAG: histidine kinase [Cytophagales bacterium]|nr:histidine kinase [Armatimonadota bacterium]
MIYSFAASTCTVVVVAYLLKRGPILAYLAGGQLTTRAALKLGLFLGLVGLVELYFAKERAPYDTYTLIVTFAALRCGGAVGSMTAALMIVGAPLFLQQEALGRAILSILFCLIAALAARRVAGLSPDRRRIIPGNVVIAAGVSTILFAEADAILLRLWIGGAEAAPFSLKMAVLRVGANSVGLVLLHMILNDALTRQTAERFRLEAERSRAMLAEAELGALRARIHPHFLFNALTSIAALCRLAPDRAEAATIQLAQIMRRALESSARAVQPLEEEAEYVTDYVEIEKLRLGARLRFEWDIAPEAQSAGVPPFVLQTLVENSILHGIAPKLGPGCVRVTARKQRSGHVLVAVADDGVGMTPTERRRALPPLGGVASSEAAERDPQGDTTLPRRSHGLALCSEQLCLVYGPDARIRLFSRRDAGTLAAFRIPPVATVRAVTARGTGKSSASPLRVPPSTNGQDAPYPAAPRTPQPSLVERA